MTLAQETLDFRRESFSLSFSLLMSAYSLVYAPHVLTIMLHRIDNAPLPLCRSRRSDQVHSFGIMLSPVELSAQADLTSELLRFL
jgi:hypothetical protein